MLKSGLFTIKRDYKHIINSCICDIYIAIYNKFKKLELFSLEIKLCGYRSIDLNCNYISSGLYTSIFNRLFIYSYLLRRFNRIKNIQQQTQHEKNNVISIHIDVIHQNAIKKHIRSQ